MEKGDRVQVRAILEPQVIRKFPVKHRRYVRRLLETERCGYFLGWSMRYAGRIEWEGDEIGYAFYRDGQHKVAVVARDDGTHAFRKPMAVLPEDINDAYPAGLRE